MKGHKSGPLSDEHKRKIVETRRKNGSYLAWNKGIPMKESSKLKLRIGHKKRGIKPPSRLGIPNTKNSGENCHLWRGGITPINRAIRTSLEYKQWRENVFKRDNWTCVKCRTKGCRKNPIQAHHIKPFSTHPELRFELSNGITLCIPCHKKTDTWGINQFTANSLTVDM